MNFKTYFTEAKKSDRAPVVVDFERIESGEKWGMVDDLITVQYKGETYRIEQIFTYYKNINSVTKKHNVLLSSTGLQKKVDGSFRYLDLRPPKRTLPGGEFYTDLIHRKLNLSREEYEVLKFGVMGQHERGIYLKRFASGMKPETSKHFGDIIGTLRDK